MPYMPYNVPSIAMYSTTYTLCCRLYTMHRTVYDVLCKMWGVCCTSYSVRRALPGAEGKEEVKLRPKPNNRKQEVKIKWTVVKWTAVKWAAVKWA